MENIFKEIDYDKISDDLYIMGSNTILRFNVSLAKVNSNDSTRIHYHKEFKYATGKYSDRKEVSIIRRSFDFFLSIENFKNTDAYTKEFIMIRTQDMYFIRESLKVVRDWMRGELFNKIFAKKNGALVVLYSPKLMINGLAQDKYIEVEPCIITYKNDITTTGIRMYLSNNANYVDMSFDKFMGMLYLIDSINMYEAAQLMINYIQRPELGTNQISFDRYNHIDDAEVNEETISKQKRTITKNNKSSFFDNMGKL